MPIASSFDMNVAILGHRGSGKTTICHKLAGLDSPVHPGGTSTLNYVSCKWDGRDVLIWDFPPGFSPETMTFLDDIDQVVVCVDGRRLHSSLSCVEALNHLFSGSVCICVTKYNIYSALLPFMCFDTCHKNMPVKAFFCSYGCNSLRNFIINNNSG